MHVPRRKKKGRDACWQKNLIVSRALYHQAGTSATFNSGAIQFTFPQESCDLTEEETSSTNVQS
jgi:hypothetical protein